MFFEPEKSRIKESGGCVIEGGLTEGEICDLSIKAKNLHGEGIGTVNNNIIFVRNAKTRIGKTYKVRIKKLYRTFAYAELAEDSKYFIGNGSLIITQ